jgi:hypothetical protein
VSGESNQHSEGIKGEPGGTGKTNHLEEPPTDIEKAQAKSEETKG